MIKKIYLITHGEASHSVNSLVGGWYESNLTEKGITQANSIKKKLIDSGDIKCELRAFFQLIPEKQGGSQASKDMNEQTLI